jgi:hypothetical protein
MPVHLINLSTFLLLTYLLPIYGVCGSGGCGCFPPSTALYNQAEEDVVYEDTAPVPPAGQGHSVQQTSFPAASHTWFSEHSGFPMKVTAHRMVAVLVCGEHSSGAAHRSLKGQDGHWSVDCHFVSSFC